MEWILILIRKIIKIEYHFRIRNEATRRSYAYVFFFKLYAFCISGTLLTVGGRAVLETGKFHKFGYQGSLH